MTKQSKNVYENNQHYCESSERKNCGRCRNRFFSCFLCWGARMIDIHQHIPHFHFDYLVLFDDFFSLSVLTVIFNTVAVEQNNTASFRVSLKSAVQNSSQQRSCDQNAPWGENMFPMNDDYVKWLCKREMICSDLWR